MRNRRSIVIAGSTRNPLNKALSVGSRVKPGMTVIRDSQMSED
jgi:hypothetical protein